MSGVVEPRKWLATHHRISQVIQGHRIDDMNEGCECGWWSFRSRETYAEHLAADLVARGLRFDDE